MSELERLKSLQAATLKMSARTAAATVASKTGFYVYTATYKWSAWRRLVSLDVPDLKAKIEKTLREKLKLKVPNFKAVERVSHTITKDHKFTKLGIYHHEVEGTTTVVFTALRPYKKGSPVDPATAAACILVAKIAVTALLVIVTAVAISMVLHSLSEVLRGEPPEAPPADAPPEVWEAYYEAQKKYTESGGITTGIMGVGALIVVAIIGYALITRKK